MKRAFLKDIFRELRHTRSRFLSILIMIALASLFLCGLRSASPDMQLTSDLYYDRQHLMDYRVISTLGLEPEDVAALAALDGIACAEGGYSLDASAKGVSSEWLVKLHALSDQVNVPVLQEGRLPERSDECAVEQQLLGMLGVQIGDTITLGGNEDLADQLTGLQFTITGTVESPYYIGINRGTSTLGDGEVDAYLFVPPSAITLEYYTEINLLLENAAELLCYDEAYDALVREMEAVVTSTAQKQVDRRYSDIIQDAQTEIDDAAAELEDAEQEMLDQERSSRAKLADARVELDQGWADYEAAQEEFAQEIADAEAALADARVELENNQQLLNQNEQVVYANRQALMQQEDEAENALLAAEQELAAQKAQLDGAEAQYAAGLAEYEVGVAQLEQARQQLELLREQYQLLVEMGEDALALELRIMQLERDVDEMRRQLDEAELQLQATRTELDAAQTMYQAGVDELAAQRATTEDMLEEAWIQIRYAEGQLISGRQALEDGRAEYERGVTELETARLDGQQQLADALAELEQGETDYADGVQTLNEELAEARAELDDAWLEIEDARSELAGVERGKLYLLERTSIPNYVGYQQDSDRIGALGNVFPVLFFVVAALVCLTTMTRMVEEQRTQIGVFKAVGYGTWPVAQKFLIYGSLAAVIGTVIGCIIGTYLIPWIICSCYTVMYTLPSPELPWHWGTCIGVAAASLGCTLLAVLWAAWASVSRTPAELMRPRAPKAGKRILLERIGPLWRRMNFSAKVSARNLLRYQKRFWMTVIGVGGCTALIIAGFGLQEGILSILDRQFGRIYTYDLQVTLDDTASEYRRAEALRWIDDSAAVESSAGAHFSTVTLAGSSRSEEGYLVAAENAESLLTQFALRDYETGELLTLPQEGCIITAKLSELLELSAGDEIVIDAGERVRVPIAAVSEQYVQHYVYFSSAAYTQAFGETVPLDTVFATLSDQSREGISQTTAQLLELPAVAAVTNLHSAAESFQESMSVVNYAVFIIIFAAAALAFVVLYNLTNINITERMRELATLKVLGFFDGELAMYVYRENIVLTLLGIALGQLFGGFLSTYMVRTIEIDMVMFGRNATWTSYVWSIVLSLVFALLVNVAMFFRLRKIDMIESLKSVE